MTDKIILYILICKFWERIDETKTVNITVASIPQLFSFLLPNSIYFY
jgi:hypothetical protein